MWFWKRKFRRTIARLEINGVISAPVRKWVLEGLEFIKERQFPALLLRIDSPGGTVGDSQEIHRGICRLRTENNVKVVASFGNISASGGVYVGVAADYIMANAGTITGSIGVILRGNNLEKLLDRLGISFKTIKSGQFKDILGFDRPMTPAESAILQSLIDNSYEQFVQVVAEGRKLSPATVKSFADGRIFTGEQALGLGLVDRLGTEADARRWTAELVGLDPEKTKVYNLKPPQTLASRLLPRGAMLTEHLAFLMETNGLPLWLCEL
ncbi:MAG: signal peptide peptidase SppA [Pseudanabaenaceae cyanobacterium]